MSKIPGPDIYPLDCIVLGNTTSLIEGGDPKRRALHFWGYARDTKKISVDNTRLCFVDYYEPTDSSSHGAVDNPIFHSLKLQYLGLRFDDVEKIMAYFQKHFEMRPMASAKMAFTTSGGDYRRVLTRWPASYWYFLFPGKESPAMATERQKVWAAWTPAA